MTTGRRSRRAIGAGALLLGTACGGIGADDAGRSASPTAPAAAASRPERPPPPSFAAPNEPVVRPEPVSDAAAREARKARYIGAVQAVDDILGRSCGACHGKSVPTAPCGLRFDDSDDLYVLALVVPLGSDVSRVVQVIDDGSMPPPGVQPRPSASELDRIRAFIDDPAFWAGLPPDGRDYRRAYADAETNACVAPEPGVDAGDAGAAIGAGVPDGG